jgi:hypothetical protein
MADEKVTNLEAIRTQSTTPLPATTPDVQPLHKRQHDNPSHPDNVAKYWKKPWDK